jgi:hypothetical protein
VRDRVCDDGGVDDDDVDDRRNRASNRSDPMQRSSDKIKDGIRQIQTMDKSKTLMNLKYNCCKFVEPRSSDPLSAAVSRSDGFADRQGI